MAKIDLSFLKHKELPTKEVEVELNGEIQKVTIKPINGRGLTSLGLISPDDVDRTSKLCLLALMYGLDISQEQAVLFMNNDTLNADTLAAQILSLTGEYQTELTNAKIEIKKNLKKIVKK